MVRNNLKGKTVIIAGGSIAGCAIAILLHRLGINIKIFERSARPLEGRGAGIVLPEPFIKQCIDLDLFDVDMPRVPISRRSFFVKNGRKIWGQLSFSVSALNWADIYQNLRKRVPKECYNIGEAVNKIDLDDQTYQIETSAAKTYQTDMLVAADGIDSTIRKQVFPSVGIEYANYVAWRGIIDTPEFVERNQFLEHIPYYVFPKGHLLLYCIPASNYQKEKKKLLNWVMYEDQRNRSLTDLLIDKSGKKYTVSLPPGSLTTNHIQHLHELSHQSLPAEIAKMICQTQNPFLQAVFDLQVTNFVKDRICFIGDAASVLRPHTASGTLKAMQDSIRLAEAFANGQDDLTASLNDWDKTQAALARDQVALAKNMGEALVTHPPKWENMDEELMNDWWKKVMSGKKWYATDRDD